MKRLIDHLDTNALADEAARRGHVKMVPFEFSTSTTHQVMLSENYARFFKDPPLGPHCDSRGLLGVARHMHLATPGGIL